MSLYGSNELAYGFITDCWFLNVGARVYNTLSCDTNIGARVYNTLSCDTNI